MDHSQNDPVHPSSIGRFSAMTLRVSAVATLVLSGVAYAAVSDFAAMGVMLGGIAGILGLRLLSNRVERLATIAPQRLHVTMLAGSYLRVLLYGAFLAAGYYLDKQRLHGLFGVLAGILIVRFVTIYVVISQSRARPPGSA